MICFCCIWLALFCLNHETIKEHCGAHWHSSFLMQSPLPNSVCKSFSFPLDFNISWTVAFLIPSSRAKELKLHSNFAALQASTFSVIVSTTFLHLYSPCCSKLFCTGGECVVVVTNEIGTVVMVYICTCTSSVERSIWFTEVWITNTPLYNTAMSDLLY